MTKKLFFIFLSVFFLLEMPVVQSAQFGGDEKNPFVVGYDDGPLVVTPGQEFIFRVNFEIPENFYLYGESLDITLSEDSGLILKGITKPPADLKEDPFQGKTVPVYHNEITLDARLEMPPGGGEGVKTITGDIQYQGCSTELCYKVMHLPLKASFTAAGSAAANPPEEKAGFIATALSLLRKPDFTEVTKENFWLLLLISFVGGLLTDLTPCVWPLIPVTLAIIGVRKDVSIAKNLAAVGVLVSGMSVMYSVLGLAAAFLGKSLGFFFQSAVFLIILEIVLLAMAASLLGLFNFQLPPSFQARLSRLSASGYRGVFLIGLTMGFLAAPCVGPVVGPLLVFVAKTQDLFTGFFLLLSYALGMGFLFLLLGGLYGILKLKIRGGSWTLVTKRILGVLLVLVAFYYGQSLYAQVTSARQGGAGIASLTEGLKLAQASKKPLVVDFFAQWCPPCHELERKVWRDKEVKAELSSNWVFVKIDCTQDTPECREAVSAFDVSGWPTIVILDRKQKQAEKLVGKVISAQEMMEILGRAKKQ